MILSAEWIIQLSISFDKSVWKTKPKKQTYKDRFLRFCFVTHTQIQIWLGNRNATKFITYAGIYF